MTPQEKLADLLTGKRQLRTRDRFGKNQFPGIDSTVAREKFIRFVLGQIFFYRQGKMNANELAKALSFAAEELRPNE